MEYHWDHFTRMKYVKAPIETVFDYWTKPGLVDKWFLKKAIYEKIDGTLRHEDEYPQPGDTYHWEWIQDLKASGKILALEQNKMFQFTFGKNGDTGEDIIVTVYFKAKNNETIYKLEQKNMGGDLSETAHYHLSCNKGWDYFMTNLKALLNFGVDLREHDAKRAYNELAVSL